MMEKENKYMVCVKCLTFNHGQYIEDALDSFCIQQTTFPFVCVIVDDSSTDGEPEVIERYMDEHFDLNDASIVRQENTDDYRMVFARHKDNQNCYFSVYYLKYNHYSISKSKMALITEWTENAKYHAICEGDDYWIDPMKLQKQVDFLEAHPEHSLCFCAHKTQYPDGTMIDTICYEDDVEQCPMEDIILGGGSYMATNSMLYRNSMYVPFSTWAVDCPIGDLPLLLTLANKGKVGYLKDIMCVYRIFANGSWTQKRQSADIKRRRSHYRAIRKMWYQFDEWSERKYHKIVVKKLRKNKFTQYKRETRRLIRWLSARFK